MSAEVLLHMIRSGQVKNIVRHGLDIDPYRKILWEHLVPVPSDRTALARLVKSADNCTSPLPSLSWTEEVDTLTDETSKKSSLRLLRTLLAWSPDLGDCGYLPDLVFPFAKYYHHGACDVEASAHLAMTVVWNLAEAGMFAFHPDPPFQLLAAVEKLVNHYESSLVRHLSSIRATAVVYAWPVLASSFSEVTHTEKDWATIWDNVFAGGETCLILCLVASWVICSKSDLMNLNSSDEVGAFVRQPNPNLDVGFVVQKAHKIFESAPRSVHPRAVVSESFVSLSNYDSQKVVLR